MKLVKWAWKATEVYLASKDCQVNEGQSVKKEWMETMVNQAGPANQVLKLIAIRLRFDKFRSVLRTILFKELEARLVWMEEWDLKARKVQPDRVEGQETMASLVFRDRKVGK